MPGFEVQIAYPLLRTDLLTEMDGVHFEEVFRSRTDAVIINPKMK